MKKDEDIKSSGSPWWSANNRFGYRVNSTHSIAVSEHHLVGVSDDLDNVIAGLLMKGVKPEDIQITVVKLTPPPEFMR